MALLASVVSRVSAPVFLPGPDSREADLPSFMAYDGGERVYRLYARTYLTAYTGAEVLRQGEANTRNRSRKGTPRHCGKY